MTPSSRAASSSADSSPAAVIHESGLITGEGLVTGDQRPDQGKRRQRAEDGPAAPLAERTGRRAHGCTEEEDRDGEKQQEP
jgi:hypothetical protein